ncbi:MAG: hypothetical protein Q4C00_04365 [Bacillota bacterium]|nr:hypothetical protein [Bacillota bacterium]
MLLLPLQFSCQLCRFCTFIGCIQKNGLAIADYAHDICKKLDECRKSGLVHDILPDGKAQVTVGYRDGKPARVKTLVVSIQHKENVQLEQLRSAIISNVLWPVFEKFPFDKDTEILVNPFGRLHREHLRHRQISG